MSAPQCSEKFLRALVQLKETARLVDILQASVQSRESAESRLLADVAAIQASLLKAESEFAGITEIAGLSTVDGPLPRAEYRLEDVGMRGEVVFHDQAQWVRFSNRGEEGPFCPSCWSEGLLRRPQVSDVDHGYVEFLCREHRGPFYFRVPKEIVAIGDLSSYGEVEGGA